MKPHEKMLAVIKEKAVMTNIRTIIDINEDEKRTAECTNAEWLSSLSAPLMVKR